ncbi:SDR family NAD(P)-dependent oxidoreductase [Paenibacillus bovis]|uniref:Short-chain dehydrogenase n=1 Tax=Paenibacillus bovis TaxID=1616788 RepID=A0A172ZCV7_9BACL|nr:SDR family NAD(P)-dependent oxidoreductase [Paenibacillus bovis]ANF94990.1 short-chain dehydrogenase [Paenibacillus bovis]
MTNSIALVTGASKGIGLEVARQLGQQGITVLLSARTLAAAEEAASELRQENIDVQGVQLEVTNEEHINELAQWIEEKYGRLDILVNNAGVLLENSEYEGDVFRDTFEVNTYAPYRLTEKLLPLLLKSPAGRVVNQSSAIGSIALQLTNEQVQKLAQPAYAASKAALNMLTAYWSQQHKAAGLKVNSVHPGLVKTRLGGEHGELSVTDGAKTAVRLATLPAEGPTGEFYYMDDQLPW